MPKHAILIDPLMEAVLAKLEDATGQRGPAKRPGRHEIEALAHELWIQRGCPEGSPDEDWFQSERELNQKFGNSER